MVSAIEWIISAVSYIVSVANGYWSFGWYCCYCWNCLWYSNLFSLFCAFISIFEIKAVQLIHDWQHIGKRKGHFLKSIDKTFTDSSEEVKRVLRCPLGCGERKSPMHYIFCKAKMYVSDRVDLRRTLKKNMEKLKSHDGFVQMVIQYVRTGQKPLWVQCAETQTLQRYYNEDIAAQGKLGWMQFIKG